MLLKYKKRYTVPILLNIYSFAYLQAPLTTISNCLRQKDNRETKIVLRAKLYA